MGSVILRFRIGETSSKELFTWAGKAARFFQEEIEVRGTEGLQSLLHELTAEALDDINALYGLILRLAYNKRAKDWDFEKFRRIVRAIVCLREPLSQGDLSELLDLRQTPSSTRVDILIFTRRLRTVLVAGANHQPPDHSPPA